MKVGDQNRALFVCCELDKATRLMSKAALDHWMTAAIRNTHSILGREDQIIHINPHSIR